MLLKKALGTVSDVHRLKPVSPSFNDLTRLGGTGFSLCEPFSATSWAPATLPGMRTLLFGFLAIGLAAQNYNNVLDKALANSRNRIDTIDDQIVKLLNERAAIVREVGFLKLRYQAPAAAPGRAEQVLRRAADHARPPLTSEATRKIYETILAEMTAMEAREMEKSKDTPQ